MNGNNECTCGHIRAAHDEDGCQFIYKLGGWWNRHERECWCEEYLEAEED